MSKSSNLLALVLAPLFAAFCVQTALADIRYTLKPEPASRTVLVSVSVEPTEDIVSFSIPAWCPGFYQIRNYERSISDVRAVDHEGQTVAVQHPSARTWTVKGDGLDRVTISYRVQGDDQGLGFFGVHIGPKNGFVNGPAAFMYVDGRLTEACTLKIENPEGWDVATAMDFRDKGYSAPGYDEFIDHPIELGQFKRVPFKAGGASFEAIFSAPDGKIPDRAGEVEELRALSEPAIKMFGGTPFKKYLYIVHLAVGSFGGGLEHRASTVLAVPNSDPVELGSLAAHEFFHAWNVKHIRPVGLGPFDYANKVRTKDLWFVEGVTDYYAQLHTYEAGIYGEPELLSALGYEIDSLHNSQTRRTKTLEDVCWSTWEADGFGSGDLSYYTKGLVVGLVLDAAIRNATNGQRSLDDVMRHLYERHRLPKPGFEDGALRKAISEVALKDLSALYDQCVRSTQEIPYSVLETIGLQVLAPGTSYESWAFDVRDGLISGLRDHAKSEGLREGDRIIQISDSPSGDPDSACLITVERRSHLVELAITKAPTRASAFRLVRLGSPSDRAARLLNGWLRSGSGARESASDNLVRYARASRSRNRSAHH
jgi:predicted metalloprotease with PDZ domain